MSELNIVELIENHPISKLTNTYNVKLLDKIKANFSDAEQQLFIGSFYCYLNYDTKKDFVVDLDNVWKWMGFSQKYNTERIISMVHYLLYSTEYNVGTIIIIFLPLERNSWSLSYNYVKNWEVIYS